MKVTVFGCGYVGLTTAACLASVGNKVVNVDIDQEKVFKLSQCELDLYEPGLEELIRDNVSAGKLIFSTSARDAIQYADIIIIAVGTPALADGSCDLSALKSVANDIGQWINFNKTIIIKSTVPVGTNYSVRRSIQEIISATGSDSTFEIVSCPEFLQEGKAVENFMNPERIVIGNRDKSAFKKVAKLFQPFVKTPENIVSTDIRSAELSKFASNAILATKISFMNELSRLAESLGADIEEVRKIISMDSRIGPHFIRPGCGYGGSCFSKDIQSLITQAKRVNDSTVLLNAIEDINQQQQRLIFDKIYKYFNGSLDGKVISIWGLAFKPQTNDLRNATSRVVIDLLLEHGAKLCVFDPAVKSNIEDIYSDDANLVAKSGMYSALDNSDALAIITEWDDFKSANLSQIKTRMRNPVIFDGRNIFEPEDVYKLEISYFPVGRKQVDFKNSTSVNKEFLVYGDAKSQVFA